MNGFCKESGTNDCDVKMNTFFQSANSIFWKLNKHL